MKQTVLLLCSTILLLCTHLKLFSQCNASFTIDPTANCNCYTFTPQQLGQECYNWDFGFNGLTSTEESPTFCYSFTGNATTDVNVTLGIGCDNNIECSETSVLSVDQIPDAELIPVNAEGWVNCSADPANPMFTLAVFNGSTTAATDVLYIINWGDSTEVNGVMVPNIDTIPPPFNNTTHTYAALSAYDITLTVIGQNQCIATRSYIFFNSSATPDIGMNLDGTSNNCIGYEGVFVISNTEENPPFTKYIVRVDIDTIGGDSIVFNHPPPDTFTYIFEYGSCFDTTIISSEVYPHSFSVSITAFIDSCGAATAAVGPIRIDEPPRAAFTVDPATTLCSVEDVFELTNESIPGIYNLIGDDMCSDSTRYYWQLIPFPDNPVQNPAFTVVSGSLGEYNDIPGLGIPGSPEGVSLSISTPGNYTLALIAQSALGSVCDTSMALQEICVLPQPQASYTPTATFDCAPFLVGFNNTSNTLDACLAAEYFWLVDFLESECGIDSSFQFIGSNENSISPSIEFNSPGQYSVQLRVVNQCDTSYFDQIITVGNASLVEINPIPTACLSTIVTPSFENQADCYAPPSCVWYVPNTTNTGIDTIMGCDPPTLSYTVIGQYTISVELSNDCGTTIDSETFEIVDLPLVQANNDGEKCVGEDILLSGSSPTGEEYLWTGPDGFISFAQDTLLENVTADQAGIYTLSVTDGNGCVNTDTTALALIALPSVIISASTNAICTEDSVLLVVTGADSYVWGTDPTMEFISADSVLVFPNDTSLYTVIGENTLTGCTNVDTIQIVVNAPPFVDAGLDTFTCSSESIELLGFPQGGFWTDSEGNNIPTGIYNQSITGAYTLYYDYTDSNGCFNSDSLQVCVLNNPQANFDLSVNTGCIGTVADAINTSNTLTDCISPEYTWTVEFLDAECHEDSTGWSFVTGNANSLNASFEFSLSGEYRVQLHVANACDTVSFSQIVVIGEAPEVVIDSLDLLCEVFTISPSASIQSCNSAIQNYSWSFPGGIPNVSTLAQPMPVEYTTTGEKTIFLTVSNDCGTTTTEYVFNIFENPTAEASNDGPDCEEAEIELLGSSNVTAFYEWSGPNGFTSSEQDTLLENMSLNQQGIYSLTVTDVNGCFSIDTTQIEVLELPEVGVVAVESVLCEGETTILTALGADIYAWSPTTNLTILDDNNVEVAPTETTTYFLTGTNDLNGCSGFTSVTIIVNPLPIVEAGENLVTCSGQETQLTGTPTGAGGTWLDIDGNPIPEGLYTENVPGNYTVYYNFTNADNCSSFDSLEICVTNIPSSSFSLSATEDCIGAVINATNESSNLNDCNLPEFIWSVTFLDADCHQNEDGWSFESSTANSTNVAIEFTESGRYDVQLAVINSCDTAFFNQIVTIGDQPTIEIFPFGTLCEIVEVQPSALISACNSPISNILWTFEGEGNFSEQFEGATPPVVTFPGPGNYTITNTATNGCGTTTEVYEFTIFENPVLSAEPFDTLCAEEELQLEVDTDTPNPQFEWLGPNNFNSTIEDPTILFVNELNQGIYSVTLTDLSSTCTDTATIEVTVHPLPEVDAGPDIVLCPDDEVLVLVGTPPGGIWSFPAEGGTIDPAQLASGAYTLEYTVVDAITQCDNVSQMSLTIFPNPEEILLADSLCIDESIEINGTIYDVNNPSGIEVITSAFTGCDSLIVEIELGFWELDLITSVIEPSCFGGTDGAIIIEDISGGTVPYNYSIDEVNEIFINTIPFEIAGLGAGLYDLTVQDANGCTVQDIPSIFIDNPMQLVIELGDDIELLIGSPLNLDAQIAPFSPNPDITWSSTGSPGFFCDTCSTEITIDRFDPDYPKESTTFFATYRNEFDCEVKDTIYVSLDKNVDVYQPTVFSPNLDGINDYFSLLYNSDRFKGVKLLRIFDRWGNMVFEFNCPSIGSEICNGNRPQFGWDGKFKGELMNPAVFGWYAELVKIDDKILILKGDITLIR